MGASPTSPFSSSTTSLSSSSISYSALSDGSCEPGWLPSSFPRQLPVHLGTQPQVQPVLKYRLWSSRYGSLAGVFQGHSCLLLLIRLRTNALWAFHLPQSLHQVRRRRMGRFFHDAIVSSVFLDTLSRRPKAPTSPDFNQGYGNDHGQRTGQRMSRKDVCHSPRVGLKIPLIFRTTAAPEIALQDHWADRPPAFRSSPHCCP